MPYDALTESPFAPGFVPPNGESVEAFHGRVARAFALIALRRRALSGPLVVITHGLVCAAILENHSQGAVVSERFDNTAVTVLDPAPPFTTRLINCTQHLSAIDRVGGGPGSAQPV
jgi:probable phosphoglycerate mutase